MKIQVLGPGCVKCTQLAENAVGAAKELGIDCQVEKIHDMSQIAHFGVILSPALVIDGEVRSVGRVSSQEELRNLLQYLKKTI